ncbi:hypothetical protein [Clostridium saudiense]|nr:hypothetical protein [Clostridium saudiense]
MNILLILKVVGIVLQLIASGLSEGESVSQASAMFGIPKSLLRKFL